MNRRQVLGIGLAIVAAPGCSLVKPAGQAAGALGKIGGRGGSGSAGPRRNTLKTIVLSRPIDDPALAEALWRAADAQAVQPDAARRALEANGLRVGLVAGDLPAEVEAIVAAPPPQQVDPQYFDLPDAHNALVSLSPPRPPALVSLLVARDGQVKGNEYVDARGHLRLTATRRGADAVDLRVVPELHHGPIRRRVGTDANASPFEPMEFTLVDGQQEETFRDLAATVTLRAGQAMAVGSRPELTRSLGGFLMTEPEPNSDRMLQKVLLVWAIPVGPPAADAPEPPPAGLLPVDPPDWPEGAG